MKNRFVIEFTVEAEDYSDESIEVQALQELTCMSPFPEDIDFHKKDNPWHTGTPTEKGWYLIAYIGADYSIKYAVEPFENGKWLHFTVDRLAWQKIELYKQD